jgi:hypothetical protein
VERVAIARIWQDPETRSKAPNTDAFRNIMEPMEWIAQRYASKAIGGVGVVRPRRKGQNTARMKSRSGEQSRDVLCGPIYRLGRDQPSSAGDNAGSVRWCEDHNSLFRLRPFEIQSFSHRVDQRKLRDTTSFKRRAFRWLRLDGDFATPSNMSSPRPDRWTPRRGLSRVEGADYLGISPSKFDQMRADGRVGPPKLIDGRKVFDIRMLDDVFDALPLENHDSDSEWHAEV